MCKYQMRQAAAASVKFIMILAYEDTKKKSMCKFDMRNVADGKRQV